MGTKTNDYNARSWRTLIVLEKSEHKQKLTAIANLMAISPSVLIGLFIASGIERLSKYANEPQ